AQSAECAISFRPALRAPRPAPRAARSDSSMWPDKVDLFGVGVSVTTSDQATAAILQAAQQRIPAVVACQAVHAIVTASDDPALRDKVNTFDLVTPDGQPVRWAMNLLYGTQLS